MSTYAEIQEEIKQLQERAEEQRKLEIETVISDINEKIALFNIKPKDLLFPDSSNQEVKLGSKQAKNKLPPKYRHRITGKEWCGIGRVPNWYKDATNEEKESMTL
jgi:DNA-binding protein H-NS